MSKVTKSDFAYQFNNSSLSSLIRHAQFIGWDFKDKDAKTLAKELTDAYYDQYKKGLILL